MDYHYDHFAHVTTPQRLEFIDLLQNLDQGLAHILQQELDAGNAISQVSDQHWDFSLSVHLERPFQKHYAQKTTTFSRSTAPHHQGQSYSLREPKQNLEAPLSKR